MRRHSFHGCLLAVLAFAWGCGSGLVTPDAGGLATMAEWGSTDGSTSLTVAPSGAAAGSSGSAAAPIAVSGSVSGPGAYRLFDLGPAETGDDWTVSLDTSSGGLCTVVLLDADEDLLMRATITARNPLVHVVRRATPNVILGVMAAYGASAAEFSYEVLRTPGESVPPPRQQVAYLDFRAAENVVVHGRAGLTFGAFDGAALGTLYVGHSQDIKDAIVATVREDYGPYDVVVVTSDEAPPPAGVPVSVICFGGDDSGLLGLADNVDPYNVDLQQNAIIFTDAFAPYITMQLAPDEMGVMIGNVASHELGHLLGLYHTHDPAEVMDTTGSAWDLAGAQAFHRAALEETVFATGMQNAPRLLEQTLGLGKQPPALPKVLGTAKMLRYRQLRSFMEAEMHARCGLCIDPDE